MKTQPFVIISTRLPPATCGIGTYSARLREHWPNESRAVEFLVMESAAGASSPAKGDRITPFHGSGAQLARELDRIGAADALLHYAGRAYQRFGLPIWMPGVLARWKNKFRGARLMIFVHELPGRLPLSSRHFWLGKVNEWIVRRLSASADVLVTNTEGHGAALRRISGRSDIQLFPVGSNIESAAGLEQARARTEFLIFGLSFGRLQTLRLFHSHLRAWQSAGRLTKLHIVGPDDDEFSPQADELIGSWPDQNFVSRHGALPSAEVSELLQRVGVALTNVSPQTWSKSGAFMACAVNRCPVVMTAARPASVPLVHAVSVGEVMTISDAELANRSAALAEWYRANADWPVAAKRMAALW